MKCGLNCTTCQLARLRMYTQGYAETSNFTNLPHLNHTTAPHQHSDTDTPKQISANMPPTKRAAAPQSRSATPSTAAAKGNQFHKEILQKVVKYYTKNTNARTKLIDVFLVFLVVVGVIQFVYCVVAGNYVRRLSSLLMPCKTARPCAANGATFELTGNPLCLSCSLSMLSSLGFAQLSGSLS